MHSQNAISANVKLIQNKEEWFWKDKGNSVFLLLLFFCICNVYMAPYGHVCSVGSFRYGSIVCSTSTDSDKSFLVLVMAEFGTSGTNCFSNQIKLNVMAFFNVSCHYISPVFYFLKSILFYIRFYYFLKSLIQILFWIFSLCFFYCNYYISSQFFIYS